MEPVRLQNCMPQSLCSVLCCCTARCTGMYVCLRMRECKCGRRAHADKSTWRETCRCAALLSLDTSALNSLPFPIPCLLLSHFPSLLPSLFPFFFSYHPSLLLELEPRTIWSFRSVPACQARAPLLSYKLTPTSSTYSLVHREIKVQRARGTCTRSQSKSVAFPCDSVGKEA